MPDQHGNRFAREGVDFCVCGSKYWEDDRCMDCGNRMTVIRLTTRELLFAVDYLGDHDQEFVNEDAEWPVSGRDIATKIREQLPSPR